MRALALASLLTGCITPSHPSSVSDCARLELSDCEKYASCSLVERDEQICDDDEELDVVCETSKVSACVDKLPAVAAADAPVTGSSDLDVEWLRESYKQGHCKAVTTKHPEAHVDKFGAMPGQDYLAWHYVGLCYLRVEKPRIAAKAFYASYVANPNFIASVYNVACAAALYGDTKGALKALRLTVGIAKKSKKTRAKYRKLMREDADLDVLRSDPTFTEIVRSL